MMSFEKFMKNIVQHESDRKVHKVNEKELKDNPAREYRQRYAELWQNRIIWGKKVEKRDTND